MQRLALMRLRGGRLTARQWVCYKVHSFCSLFVVERFLVSPALHHDHLVYLSLAVATQPACSVPATPPGPA